MYTIKIRENEIYEKNMLIINKSEPEELRCISLHCGCLYSYNLNWIKKSRLNNLTI